MKVELHLHTTRYSACAVNTPQEMMRRLVDAGYEAVYITEHDAFWSDEELAQLRAAVPGLRIFPGVELSLGRHHLLVLGTNDPAYLSLDSEAEAVEKARDERHLTVLAHPFRWEGGAEMLEADEESLLPDAIELRTPNQDAAQAQAAAEAAGRLNLSLVNAGDAHALDFIDRFWIETLRPIELADDIRNIVIDGAYGNCARE